jgi:hypothetical protein
VAGLAAGSSRRVMAACRRSVLGRLAEEKLAGRCIGDVGNLLDDTVGKTVVGDRMSI